MRPESRDVQEVFAQLDQNWQELVKVIKEGSGQPGRKPRKGLPAYLNKFTKMNNINILNAHIFSLLLITGTIGLR